MKSVASMIGSIATLSTLAVVIIFFLSRLVNMKKLLWLVAIYSALSFGADVILQTNSRNPPYFVLFTFTLVEYACFAGMFYQLLQKQLNKNLVLAGSVAFMIMVTFSLLQSEVQHFDNINTGTEAILIIVYSVLFFSEKMSVDNLEPIFDNPASFIVIACLFYLAGNLFLFITSEEMTISTWVINSAFNLIRNIFFIVTIRKCTKAYKPATALRFT